MIRILTLLACFMSLSAHAAELPLKRAKNRIPDAAWDIHVPRGVLGQTQMLVDQKADHPLTLSRNRDCFNPTATVVYEITREDGNVLPYPIGEYGRINTYGKMAKVTVSRPGNTLDRATCASGNIIISD